MQQDTILVTKGGQKIAANLGTFDVIMQIVSEKMYQIDGIIANLFIRVAGKQN